MPITAIAERSKELIIPSNASGKPALFKKFENIVAPNNNANSLAARTDASLKTLKYSLIFRFPLEIAIINAPAAPIPAASVAEKRPM